MAEVSIEIAENLKDQILKKFKEESKIIFRQIYSLKDNPNKGKILGSIGSILIKELKYKNFRFYFITDGFKLRLLNEAKLVDILLKFVRMSDKNNQQKTINEIRNVLKFFGPNNFN